MRAALFAVTLLAALLNLFAASNDFIRPRWLLTNMARLGVDESTLPWLGLLKIAGGLGLLIGLMVPIIGIAAAAGLILFFSGAIVVALRARWFAHLPMPMTWLALAAAALALRLFSP